MSRMQAQRNTHTFGSLAFCLLLLCCCAATAAAQDGRITGTVRNSTKAPMAGVTVMAINQVTTKRETTRTSSGGTFSFKVPAGAYRILVNAPDMQTFDRENIIVEPGKDATVDIDLQALKEPLPKPVDPTANEQPAGNAGHGTIGGRTLTRPVVKRCATVGASTSPSMIATAISIAGATSRFVK